MLNGPNVALVHPPERESSAGNLSLEKLSNEHFWIVVDVN